ncbi:MAG TPA: HAD family hydrolase [Methanomassiliicoccales archaeon]|jgi:phosphoglycolate phosphatase
MTATDSGNFRIKGLVFDLDGTLVHSTIDFSLMRKSALERMREAGVPASVLDERMSIASNLKACYHYLSETRSGDDARSLLTDVGRIMNEIEMRNVRNTLAVPRANQTLCRLIDEGYGMAVLTRGSRRYTDAALSASGLTRYFDKTICRDDYPDEEAKPNPISLSRAAGKLGLTNEECLLVGDHAMDLECARSAGSGFVGVLSGATDMPTWTNLGVIRIIPDVTFLPGLLSKI